MSGSVLRLTHLPLCNYRAFIQVGNWCSLKFTQPLPDAAQRRGWAVDTSFFGVFFSQLFEMCPFPGIGDLQEPWKKSLTQNTTPPQSLFLLSSFCPTLLPYQIGILVQWLPSSHLKGWVQNFKGKQSCFLSLLLLVTVMEQSFPVGPLHSELGS